MKKVCLEKIVLSVCFAVCLLYGLKQLVRIFLCDSFIIPTESMEPTLKPGDRIYVNKTIYGARIYTDFHFTQEGQKLKAFRTKGLRDLRRNDIVVFNMPNQEWQIKFTINYVYCKRCIGLPGDSISIRNGHYVCNNYEGTLGYEPAQNQLASTPDSLIPAASLRTFPFDDHLPKWSIKNFGPLYIPKKGDLIALTPKNAALNKILIEYELEKPIYIDWKRNTVQAGNKRLTKYRFKHDYYFMAGDNAANSLDSRYWGLVPDEYIVGVVKKKWEKRTLSDL